MVRQATVRWVDDLDGSTASETVVFALDGCSFEIDLSAAHAAQLREAIRPYIAAARARDAGGRRPRPTSGGRTRPVPPGPQEAAAPGIRVEFSGAVPGGADPERTDGRGGAVRPTTDPFRIPASG